MDGDVTFNFAVFYVDWTNIQIDDQYMNPNGTTIGYTSNAGKAEVKGYEIAVEAAASDNVDPSLGYSRNPARVFDAQDSRAFRAGIITTGESHLPFSSDHSLTGALRIHGAAPGGWNWYAQIDGRYDSTQYSTTANYAETGSRVFTNLRAGVDRGGPAASHARDTDAGHAPPSDKTAQSAPPNTTRESNGSSWTETSPGASCASSHHAPTPQNSLVASLNPQTNRT